MAMLEAIRSMGRSENGIVARVAVTATEIEAAKRDGALAIVPAVENGFAMGRDLSRLAHFRALGARYLTLTQDWTPTVVNGTILKPGYENTRYRAFLLIPQ